MVSGGQVVLRQGVSEFLGSWFFTFVGACAISVTGNQENEKMTVVRVIGVALLDGFLFYTLVYLTMRLSDAKGGYFNPSITLSLSALDVYFDGNTASHLARLAFFMACQFGGSVVGAFLVLTVLPDPLGQGQEKVGHSRPGLSTTNGGAFMMELVMGFFLAVLVLSVRRNERRRSSLLLAFAFAAMRLFAYPYSGGFVNPARSFGPALVGNGWSTYYIYFFGSPIGALLGTAAFVFLHHNSLDLASEFRNKTRARPAGSGRRDL